MTGSFRSSKPDAWASPRPNTDPVRRLNAYGKIQPMPHDRRDVVRHIVLPTLAIAALFVLAVFGVAAL